MIEENVQYVPFCVTTHNTGILWRQFPQSLENTREYHSSNSLKSILNSFSRVIRLFSWMSNRVFNRIDRLLSSWLNNIK